MYKRKFPVYGKVDTRIVVWVDSFASLSQGSRLVLIVTLYISDYYIAISLRMLGSNMSSILTEAVGVKLD